MAILRVTRMPPRGGVRSDADTHAIHAMHAFAISGEWETRVDCDPCVTPVSLNHPDTHDWLMASHMGTCGIFNR